MSKSSSLKSSAYPIIFALLFITILIFGAAQLNSFYLNRERGEIGYGYYVKNNAVWMRGSSSFDAPLKIHADPATFVALGKNYGKDKNNVYLGWVKLIKVDVDSFILLNDDRFKSRNGVSVYSKDKHTAYYTGDMIPGSDPVSFTPIDTQYSKDKSRVWFRTYEVKGADLATFTTLGDGYSKDKFHIYKYGEVIDGVDFNSFEIVKENNSGGFKYGIVFAKDKNHVYHGTSTVKGVDPNRCTADTYYYCNPELFESYESGP